MKPSPPILVWTLLFSVVMIFLSPGVGDDSQVYHLPGMMNILRSGSLINFDPGQLYRAAAITNYYPRGFEAMGALLHLLPLTTPLMIAVKLGLFYTFYRLLRRHGGDQQIALALIAVFSFLKEQRIGREDVIAIHSADESSFFLAFINDYLLPLADRVVYMDEPSR